MIETFQSYDMLLQIYWIMALAASAVFVVQAIMIFTGFDADSNVDTADISCSGADTDFDADGFHLVSVKTIVCFILGFGWTGVLFWDDIDNKIVLGLVAALVGFAFMALIAWLLYLVLKLDKDNTFRVQKTVGKAAEVYLTIPAGKKDSGKIIVSIDGSVHELEAVTNDTEAIPTGTKVKIVSVEAGEVVYVERI